MRKAPIPTGLNLSRCCESLRRIAEYLKTKEDLAREEYGWFSLEAEQVRRKIDAVIDARAVIVREFDL